jgi:non-ribosomal peptide synthetase component F
VERGVGTGMSIEADALAMTAGMSCRAITERILGQADRDGAALIDACDGTVTAWPRFARTVRAAADGLGRRGVTGGDTVAVLVQDAASYAIAVHAVRATGARAMIIGPAGPEDVAAQLIECRARMLITAAPLAGLATEAADRSWVRQVISFGEAEGTTSFSSLLDGDPQPVATQREPGPAESPDVLTHRDVVVAAPPCGEGRAYASLIDLALLAGATIVAAPVTQIPAALRLYRGSAAIVPDGTPVPRIAADRVFRVT